MPRSERNPHPIQLLVNYWELRSSSNTAMGARLDELLRLGVSELATFVPWQAVEADITHTLARFLEAVAVRKMTISLILSPEVGVHYANSGIPKDIFKKPENTAHHSDGAPIVVTLPPNSFSLPSLMSPEFGKRYHSFLSRMDHFLADLGKRGEPGILDGVNVVLSGSFWKYYRVPHASSASAFGGTAGDFSTSASLNYRQHLDQQYSQREFMDPSPASANRWKTRALEDVNHRRFFQQAEDVFRVRSTQFVRRKALPVKVKQIELFTPEADPGFAYSNFLQMISGGHADFSRLSAMIDDAAARLSLVGDHSAAPFIHWTSLGGFRTLLDSEKQFLILKSILLMKGGILIDESEWFSLSPGFRTRAETLARSIASGELTLKTKAYYLNSHLWSSGGTLWDELQKRLGPSARMVASLDLVSMDRDADLLVVDPTVVLTHEAVMKLLNWAKAGHVVVVPRSPLYTESARAELERACAGTNRMDIDLGVFYRLHAFGQGKLVVYDLPEAAGTGMRGEVLSAWQSFLTAVLSVAGIQSVCNLSDGRLSSVALERRGQGLGLFILNGTGRAVAADILFSSEVVISDLSLSQSGDKRNPAAVPATRFALEVPPGGVLPLSVRGNGLDLERERRSALRAAEETNGAALFAAGTELPGFSESEMTWS